MLTLCPKAEPFSLETRIKESLNTEFYFDDQSPNSAVSPQPMSPEASESQPLDFSTRRDRDEAQMPPLRRDRTRMSQSPESGVSSGSDSPTGSYSPSGRSSSNYEASTYEASSRTLNSHHRLSLRPNILRASDLVSHNMESLDIRRSQMGFPVERSLLSPNAPSARAPSFPTRFFSPDSSNDANVHSAAALNMEPQSYNPLLSPFVNPYFVSQLTQAPQPTQPPMTNALQKYVFEFLAQSNAANSNIKDIANISCVKHLQDKMHISPSELPTVPNNYNYQCLQSVAQLKAASDQNYAIFKQQVQLKKREDHPTKSRKASRRMEVGPYDRPSEESSFNEEDDDPEKRQYIQKRKKNNEAAKKSRDQRKSKEEETAIRAAFLEQENQNFRLIIQQLKSYIESLLFQQANFLNNPK